MKIQKKISRRDFMKLMGTGSLFVGLGTFGISNFLNTFNAATGVSSGRLYWEYKGSYFDVKNVSIPVAVSFFPDEIYTMPRSWAERAYPKLIYYNKVPKGGHFAAWEQPQLYSEEVRAGLRSLRQ
jgi:pimeloyl-ACP methyl ester carboxylesterase